LQEEEERQILSAMAYWSLPAEQVHQNIILRSFTQQVQFWMDFERPSLGYHS